VATVTELRLVARLVQLGANSPRVYDLWSSMPILPNCQRT